MISKRYHLATEKWLEEFNALHVDDQLSYLFLSRHERYTERWSVDGLDGSWILDMEDLVGKYRTLHLSKLNLFLDTCEERGYHVVFFEDPNELLEEHEAFRTKVPGFSLNSTLENTVAGMLDFQLREFNKLQAMPHGGFAVWDTGPQPVTEPVMTDEGWKSIGNLRPGDAVLGSSGTTIAVLGVYPQGQKETFRVTFSDGSYALCSEDHLWTVEYWSNGSRSLANRLQKKSITEPLSEIRKRGLFHKSGSKSSAKGRARFSLPRSEPLEFTKADPVWEPYLLGLLLGDGSFSSGCLLSTADMKNIQAFRDAGISTAHSQAYDYRIHKMGPILRRLGLVGKRSWEKSVPREYLYATKEERLALLQGLLDSDGCAAGVGASFTSTSRQLADDIVFLCRSLGGYATEPRSRFTSYTYKDEKKTGRESWRTQLTLPNRMFRLDRKEDARRPFRQLYKSIVAIEPTGEIEDMVCISVDSSDHLYLTRGFALTHNTGKTAFTVAMTKQKMEIEDFDLTLVVCKKNNRIDTQRKLKSLGNIESVVFDSYNREKRIELYNSALEDLSSGQKVVGILNYEKFKQTPDQDYLIEMITDRRVLIIWDEMPTRLSNRKTALYKAVSSVLYGRKDKKGKVKKVLARDNLRAAQMVQYCETATPVQKSPVGVLNMVRIIDPARFPFIKEWEGAYVAKVDRFTKEPAAFKNLDKMALELEDMTSRVSKKDDLEIAKLFPSVEFERFDLELSEYDRNIYDRMGKIAIDLLEDPYEEEEVSPLQLISVMQLICCAPSLISLSAERRDEFEALMEEWEPTQKSDKPPIATGSRAAQLLMNTMDEEITNDHCEKLKTLRDILETFSDDKVIIFSTLAGYIQPVLTRAFEEWGVTYEVYAGTDKQCQDAKDRWRKDPNIQVFLLSDKGSDGMDLPEAMVGVNFDLPFVWATKTQRKNRNNRVDSKLPVNIWIDLVYRDTVEERKEEIISTKQGYHEDLYDGGTDTAVGSTLTRSEMLYILRGNPAD